MDFDRCEKCSREIQFSATHKTVVSPFCGTINKVSVTKNDRIRTVSSNTNSSDSGAIIATSSVFSSDDG